ncbi:MAG: peptide chain release factor 1 [Bacilli bacterium]
MKTMFERLEDLKNRYNQITELLSSSDVSKDIKEMTKLAKEQASLNEVVELYNKYKKITIELEEALSMTKDPEMKELAKIEAEELKNKQGQLEKDLEMMLLPKDPNDEKNVIIEIRGAAGGDEANVFAGDLYRMYIKYAESKNWNIEVLNETGSEAGGYSQVEFMLKGDMVYSRLKYESGSHRVQRVPKTESSGRIHTSTATVLVMPEAEDVDIDLNMNEVKIDVYRSSGAGGQSVNTTDSAVRITHIPTGTVVTCQNERSQIKNKELAIQILKTKLYEQKLFEQEQALGMERKNKIGTGDRSEKIRTYNYPQNRVTDHRINFTLKQLDRIMEGKLDEIINVLIFEDQQRKLNIGK